MPRQKGTHPVWDAAEVDAGTAQVHPPGEPLKALGVVQGHPHDPTAQFYRYAMRLTVIDAARARIEHVLVEPASTSFVDVDVQSPVEEFDADAAAVRPRTAVQYQPGRFHRSEVELQLAAVAGVPRSSDANVPLTGSECDRM